MISIIGPSRNWRQYFNSINRWGAFAAVVLFLLAAVANQALFRISEQNRIPPEEEPVRRSPGLYQVLSFGHLPALVDWFWIVSLTETDIRHVQPGKHSTFYYLVDLMTELDPMFSEIYTNGANLIAVIQNDGPGARTILERGNRFRKEELPKLPESYRANYWSRPWQIPLLLAYVHLFELHDMPNAAIAFKEASELPGVPDYVKRLAVRLEKPGGEYEVAVKLLRFMIGSAEAGGDDKLKEELTFKLDNLVKAQFIHDLNQDFASFARKHRGAPADKLWERFSRERKLPPADPWGGRLTVAANGRLETTTPHVKVLGLE